MIKNVVFDIGNVLLRFDPWSYLVDNYSIEESLALYKTIFRSDEWRNLTRGVITLDRAIRSLSVAKADCAEDIEMILTEWPRFSLFPVESTISTASKLQKDGYKIYLLSNYAKEGYELTAERFPFLTKFDGGVISYDCHYLKPEAEIYEVLLHRYHLKAEECIYLDDMKPNVEKAEELGFHAVQYRNYNNLIKALTLIYP